ncbi:glycoside hydrolase family 2 TIM barrel-domain containing protein [Seonamhaeicola marinus]|uniref:DUF4982 domain-containing protein n=1 Tax=Seonamhaeicola marinus TaxID=1912246 RepID=A0A5D0HKA5_9FLAO|nr:glycoside hydrolase family 2 TIM barrel-domain containing protein [Seonamhaeicola marinus]TYA71728.1 DUF4982 domain-containing protein [Seonamhaeicola marinus]
MKKGLIIILFLFSLNKTFSQYFNNSPVRIKENFNKEWKFNLADSIIFSAAEFDDSDWRELEVPHDWSVEHKFDKTNSGRNAWLPGGIGWYRKHFTIPETYKNKHIEIQFDGVYRHAQVYVNGEHVGNQYDGYTSFYFDISPYLKYGKTNVIAVKVDNSIQPNCRWYSGSGIYRNTWLTISDNLHVNNWGTYITTPEVSQEKALVNIETTVENFRGKVKFELTTTLYNSKGNRVGFATSKINAKLMRQYTVSQNIFIENPELWSDKSPKLYTALTKIKVDGEVIDDYQSTFGIRAIEFDAKKGFFLNGKNMKINGVCLHHEAGVLGAAVPIEVWEYRLKTLKEFGCNAIRTAHNPASPEFMDLCDQMGFLVMDEFVDKWYDNVPYANSNLKNNFFNPSGFGDPKFYLEWQKNYKQTILRDRNHPSIIIWSVGNENHSPGNVRQNAGLKTYASFVRTLDPTRPVISGLERYKDENPSKKVNKILETTSYMDIIAMNYGEQWVNEIGSRNPDKPYLSTESYIYFNSSPTKRFANIERLPWFDVLDNNFNMGLFLWSGIDYLGESKKFPKLGTDCGLVDFAGFRKERSYLYQALWTDKPVVRIAVYEGDADDFSTSGKWGWPPMHESWNLEKGKAYDLVTYTNCESVNLYLNGKKIGNKKLSDFSNWIMKWKEIDYEPGLLKAVGIINGKEVCEFELKTSGKPRKIHLKANKTNVIKNEVALVEVNVLDNKGNLVKHLESDLSFQIKGNGKIIGLSNGNVYNTSSFMDKTSKKTNKGKCLVYLKVGNKTEDLHLTVSSNTLKTQVLTLKVN